MNRDHTTKGYETIEFDKFCMRYFFIILDNTNNKNFSRKKFRLVYKTASLSNILRRTDLCTDSVNKKRRVGFDLE